MRHGILAALAFVMTIFLSCSKEGAQAFCGNYTFKTGGDLTIAEIIEDEADDPGDDISDGAEDDENALKDSEADASEGEEDHSGDEDGGDSTSLGDGQTYTLSSESGQMDILDDGDGNMILTTNILGGGAVVYRASVEGDVLTLEPRSRIVTVSGRTALTHNIKVEVSGTARKIGNMIVFDITYSGEVEIGGKRCLITESNVAQIAKRN